MENNEGILASQSYVGAVVLEAPPIPARPPARIARPKAAKTPLISIIIPAHNEQSYIRQTLEAVKRQTLSAFEIVVVTNGCTDQTAEIARELCDQLIVMPDRGLSRARNLGGEAARGKVLIFLDADTLLEPHALEVIAQQFGPDCAAGTLKGCPDIARPSYKLMYAVKNFQHWSGLHEGSSGIILCWREHFIATGGFDEALHVTENSDLIRKLRFFGKYAFISETTVTTSMRRYENGGWARIVRMWVKLWVQSLVSDLRHEKYEAVR